MGFRIGWFSTGRDEAAREIFASVQNAISRGYIPAEIAYVFSNRVSGEDTESDAFFRLVEQLGIALLTTSSRRFEPELFKKGKDDPDVMKRWRIAFDLQIEEQIGKEKVDLIVLAGYMLIVGPEICIKYPMINLHPAAPDGPVGTWQDVIWRLIRHKATETGIMMHQVTEELDKGPPITYCTFSIRGRDFDPLWRMLDQRSEEVGLYRLIEEEGESNALFSKIRNEGVLREIPMVVETLKVLAEGRVRICRGGPCDGEGRRIRALCLSEEIEKEFIGNLK
jgi:phosphoribosylglycinamide formyltransferase-1